MTATTLVYLLSFIVLILFVLFIVIGLYFYNYVIKRNTKVFIEEDESLQEVLNDLDQHIEWLKEQALEEINMKAYDGISLHAHYLSLNKPPKKIAIVVHGYASNHEQMAGCARLFSIKYGFDVLMPDLRGHGHSGGDYIGFGWHDRLDILNWIHYLNNRYGQETELLLFGVSMGGATVSFVSGEVLPPNVKFIVSDCSYSSIAEILTYHLKRTFKLPRFPFIHIASLVCKMKAKYSFKEGNVFKMVSQSKTPILFIHGGNDEFVPTSMAHHLFNSTKSEKDLLIIDGAGHAVSYNKDSKRYEEAIDRFIKKYFINQ